MISDDFVNKLFHQFGKKIEILKENFLQISEANDSFFQMLYY